MGIKVSVRYLGIDYSDFCGTLVLECHRDTWVYHQVVLGYQRDTWVLIVRQSLAKKVVKWREM